MSVLPITNKAHVSNPAGKSDLTGESKILRELDFRRMIEIERKRTERTNKPFVLMLLEPSDHYECKETVHFLESLLAILQLLIRDTDSIGWYKEQSSVGVVYTGFDANVKSSVVNAIREKVITTLKINLTSNKYDQVIISFHIFPDNWMYNNPEGSKDPILYTDHRSTNNSRRTLLLVKRAVDIFFASLMLITLAPLFAVISLAIKASSKGPVLFRQQRVGWYGKPFTFLKFRSMYDNNDDRVHREYVTKLIANESKRQLAKKSGHQAYKLKNDRRVTAVGRILRKSSMDELPQLINVLIGDMSLVGPRPPLPYEVEVYQTWHRRRVMEVKPGITGLWQVTGRSRMRFDEMVRLDLRYATQWSPWLDLKILMLTPLAVLKGDGAY
jgi:lipopolysaccharide/colanic/teichoic acid biosynthesis glycosyltransferase